MMLVGDVDESKVTKVDDECGSEQEERGCYNRRRVLGLVCERASRVSGL